MKHFLASAGCAMGLVLTFGCASPSDSTPTGGNLSPHMSQLQHQHDKLSYAVRARNPRLANYYAAEIREQLTWMSAEFPEHEGWPVGKLIGDLTLPKIDPIVERIALRDWDGAAQAHAELTSTCNSCHAATERDFLIVLPPQDPAPSNQEFELSQ